jgi:hypothetical protein
LRLRAPGKGAPSRACGAASSACAGTHTALTHWLTRRRGRLHVSLRVCGGWGGKGEGGRAGVLGAGAAAALSCAACLPQRIASRLWRHCIARTHLRLLVSSPASCGRMCCCRTLSGSSSRLAAHTMLVPPACRMAEPAGGNRSGFVGAAAAAPVSPWSCACCSTKGRGSHQQTAQWGRHARGLCLARVRGNNRWVTRVVRSGTREGFGGVCRQCSASITTERTPAVVVCCLAWCCAANDGACFKHSLAPNCFDAMAQAAGIAASTGWS